MLRISAVLAMIAAPALAELTVENCMMDPEQHAIMNSIRTTCELTNGYDQAIASVEYGIRYLEAGRSVPWAEDGYSLFSRRGTDIPGGIEPGETVPVAFWGPAIPPRAPAAKLAAHVEILATEFASGERLPVGYPTP